MIALITGSTSGLGNKLAYLLSEKGYDIIAVGRNRDELNKLKKELKTNVIVFEMDLTKYENLNKLYEKTKDYDIDLLVNNAGFGIVEEFKETDLKTDINMIDLNIKAVHVLTKLYLNDMIKRNSGRILNISSSAAFNPGPLMSTYYATKSYVYSLTMAIYEELRRSKSNVKVHVAVPGAFNSNFFKRANIDKPIYILDVDFIANYIIKEMFKGKTIITPGLIMKITIFFSRFIGRKQILKINYNIQKKKIKNCIRGGM